MEKDDKRPTLQVSRRKAIMMLGAAMLVSRATAQSDARQSRRPACILTPEQTEGPYFVDDRLNRSDIRTDPAGGTVRAGVPLALTLRVLAVRGTGCTPVSGAMVDVWHCDADGVYSDVTDPRFDTSGKKFLRGYQITDDGGVVRFLTIYPGWYPGRTVHIHFKVRIQPTSPTSSRPYEFTSQLYFDDAITDRVLAQAPYARNGRRRQTNDTDGLFRRGGRQLILPLLENGPGYAGSFDIGVQTA
ncbi:intradiol ring-cleavage dioxygenase [Noviherbaspirillum saxi]|uniref:Twin-arginine translocation pathway signal protein n=1 Tax=Noviherbaspirillum saxi TaxID=2320863 RepID=A0A3A3G4H8_9BURK|nr:intradiol ring-cleavage dioxygenase [Noviherbaspirillum saxi]RJF95090.1 twin-arginine translocation pathway signal protein [Noviherbaspirillum saxi]